MFHFGPGRAGYNPTEQTIGVGNVSSLTTRFVAPTGGQLGSSPAIVNGVVYVASADDKLYAFDAAGSTNCSGSPASCAPLWSGTTGARWTRRRPSPTESCMSAPFDHDLYAYSRP
jgi:outer membrane protein assembly factor BamB